MTIELTLKEVVVQARRALENDTLQATTSQGVDVDACRYRLNGLRCVIGAALTDDEARFCDSNRPRNAIGSLIRRGVITADHPDALIMLQATHDECVRKRFSGKMDRKEAITAMQIAFEAANVIIFLPHDG